MLVIYRWVAQLIITPADGDTATLLVNLRAAAHDEARAAALLRDIVALTADADV